MISIKRPEEFNQSSVPKDPGVYLFKDASGEILYVGKAKNLRSRVKSYFSKSDHPAKTVKLVSNVRQIDWIVVNNEVEALLLENKLIKQHSPKYNVSLKDGKTFAYIALTKEVFPRILTSRKVSPKIESFGPYTDGTMRMDLQRLVTKVFKVRVCSKLPKRACLNFHIGLCCAPCMGNVSKEEYGRIIGQARSFLGGDYKETMAILRAQMREASKEKKYERAMELRNQIESIQLLTRRQIVDRERGYDQDVLAFRRLGEKLLVVQMGVRKGVLMGKKEFSVDYQPQVEQEFLKAFYSTNKTPREILLSEECWADDAEKKAIEEVFSARRNGPVSLTVPQFGNKRELVELAKKNIESNLGDDSALVDLQTALNLPSVPRIIETFDVSNLGGEHIVSGMVRFTDGKPDKKNYRKFMLRTVTAQDDFASVNEIVLRRYRRLSEEKAVLPDLVVIDGGPGQVSAAKSALSSLGLQIPLIGLAKENEEIYLPEESVPEKFDKMGRMMLLLRRMRDEAHRFSLGYNVKRRQMKMRGEFEAK
jgi:excinuclease ABC subunit C